MFFTNSHGNYSAWMFSLTQTNHGFHKNDERMAQPKKVVPLNAMQDEWREIQAAKENPVHFRPLYKRYYESIFRFIHRRTGDLELTADLSSQVFLKALQKLSTYDYRGVPFSAWLFRISSNEIAQFFRDEKKRRVISIQQDHLQNLYEESEEIPSSPQLDELVQALDYLKEEELQLIEMRFFEERPFKEIAQIMNMTESNAKVKTYRILERMKRRMKQQQER
jgi:RNA polymerase sigma-70 factor (ECF subfamily)